MVTAEHNACIRELLQEVNAHGKADRHMKLLTIETECRLGTLWDQEECNQFCSKEELWEAARDEEMKIPWQAANEGPPLLISSAFFSFFPCNHFINKQIIFFFFRRSKRQRNFSLFYFAS